MTCRAWHSLETRPYLSRRMPSGPYRTASAPGAHAASTAGSKRRQRVTDGERARRAALMNPTGAQPGHTTRTTSNPGPVATMAARLAISTPTPISPNTLNAFACRRTASIHSAKRTTAAPATAAPHGSIDAGVTRSTDRGSTSGARSPSRERRQSKTEKPGHAGNPDQPEDRTRERVRAVAVVGA
jgi:hypothetical protein